MEILCSYVALLPNCTCPTPSFLQIFHRRSHHRTKSNPLSLLKYRTRSKNICSLTFFPTSYCIDQENYQSSNSTSYSHHSLFEQSRSSIDSKFITNQNPETQNQEQEEKKIKKLKRLFTNMWWVDLKAALGQRINVEGIVSSVSVFVKEQHLALPHASVRDIRFIDWAELHRRGFKGVVFDKDNTITVPYSLALWGPLVSSIEQCKSVFGNDLAVFSNSAGLYEYDHDGSKARALEKAIGIKVIRHKVKKPAGTAEEIEKHFGCKSSQLIMRNCACDRWVIDPSLMLFMGAEMAF
ncbi:phosphatidylglycerophosphate phosphatase 1, chloroplastic isoform X2 [Jatropha curcas]|uniref:phosphatidylglycerophosphate phosphatase 1, chloroplastic isoform X2 n=1 Tax=Jatropha curcas TaxID=180498 RepID=UPI00189562D9|nr:phosphatidylglycerophosphate phosphatase 1, chloroplastic isoform X2 [Jatropha curcas]